MEQFFAVWKASKDLYDLERKVHIDMNEAYIRITSGNRLIVKVESTYDETEEMYQLAATRLLAWVNTRKHK